MGMPYSEMNLKCKMLARVPKLDANGRALDARLDRSRNTHRARFRQSLERREIFIRGNRSISVVRLSPFVSTLFGREPIKVPADGFTVAVCQGQLNEIDGRDGKRVSGNREYLGHAICFYVCLGLAREFLLQIAVVQGRPN